MAAQKILVKPLFDFTEVQELDSLAVLLVGIIDQFDDLIVTDPAVWMKTQREQALLDNGRVDGRFEVADGVRVAFSVQVLRIPVAGHQAGDLPATPADHIGIGVVLNVVRHRAIGRNVLAELLSTVLIDTSNSRGRAGSSGVNSMNTEVSMARKWPSGVVLLKISAKNRGLTEFMESQQGMRNATGPSESSKLS